MTLIEMPLVEDITIYQFLENLFPTQMFTYAPTLSLEADGAPVPYVVVESDTDNIDVELFGNAQLRNWYLGVYVYATDDLALATNLYYNILKATQVVRAHPGVDRTIRLLSSSGCLPPRYRDDIKRYYAVIRFRVNYLST